MDHPAEGLLRHRQWYLEATLDLGLLTSRRLAAEVSRHFELMAPMVEFLNRPFARQQKRKAMPFMAF